MKLSPEREAKVRKHLQTVLDLARDAHGANDLDFAKNALSACRFAIIDASFVISEAEADTRNEAYQARIGAAA